MKGRRARDRGIRRAYPLAALLVDHPALPDPVVAAREVRIRQGEGTLLQAAPRRDRQRCAAQLTALCALLADFDLWPGLWALRNARVVEGRHGVQVRLGGPPCSLTDISRRLGGGEAAALTLRDGVIRTVRAITGCTADDLALEGQQPGFFLTPFLRRSLEQIPGEVDRQTAANLWACRWDLPPLPQPGEVAYWSVPHERAALRLACAMVLAARAAGHTAHLRWVQEVEADTAPTPALGVGGTLVLAGRIIEEDLATLEKWATEEGRSAVVLGRFPVGWTPPPPPGFDNLRLARHLSLTGVSLDAAQRELDRRSGRFDPLSAADREALSSTVLQLCGASIADSEQVDDRHHVSPLIQVLQLLPEGLPEGFLAVHAGLGADDLRRQADPLQVVGEGGWWRLADPRRLRRHELHADVAGLFREDDPRRLRHLALANGDSTGLESWCRAALDDLNGRSVRQLLADIAPGELGQELQAALAEACLAELDLAGARRVVAGMSEEHRPPWLAWISVIDNPAGVLDLPTGPLNSVGTARALAEVALAEYRYLFQRRRSGADAAAARLEELVGHLGGALCASFELAAVAVREPELLSDRAWRRETVGEHPRLKHLLWHHYAIHLDRIGSHGSARKLLARLAGIEQSPGRMGLVNNDLGNVLAAIGRAEEGERCLLKAHRQLQAAGFQHRIRNVIFNLAVGDLDRLQVDRARRRLQEAREHEHDLFILCEQARLALAVGDEQRLGSLLAKAPLPEQVEDHRFVEALAMLRGARLLLEGEYSQAWEHLAEGGEEGTVWQCLAAAMLDRPQQVAAADGWGVLHAARLVQALSEGDEATMAELRIAAEADLAAALGVALAERLVGRLPWLEGDGRQRIAEVLADAGLTGWSRLLRSASAAADLFVPSLAELVEAASPESLAPEATAVLLAGLGLSGLEVHSGMPPQLQWRWGSGASGAEVKHGHLVLVPLGGEIAQNAQWRLLSGLLGLLHPQQPGVVTASQDETGLIGSSDAMNHVRRELRQFADSQVAVLILGETGVGKDVAANALHRMSGRKGQLQAINVAAIPDSLLESELFGSVKGAFTGADRSRPGLVSAADGGTLFLDEIGDLSLPLQVKLLRFLESHEVRPVGSTQVHKVDVRIVSATHRDLQDRVANGSFREDLYYRIASAPIRIPPLRHRRDDILQLRDLFQQEAAARAGVSPPRWSREAEAALTAYDWPGNVRQLNKVVEVALLRAAGRAVAVEHLEIAPAAEEPPSGTWEEATRNFRRQLLQSTLQRNGGNRSAAARELGISRQALLYHLKKLGLK